MVPREPGQGEERVLDQAADAGGELSCPLGLQPSPYFCQKGGPLQVLLLCHAGPICGKSLSWPFGNRAGRVVLLCS